MIAPEPDTAPLGRREWAVPLALFAVALAVRLPALSEIPPPTDETDELLWALSVARDGARPLTASDPYIGPLAGYLTAGAFALVGPSIVAGRAVAAFLGALAAPGAWALARAMGGPWAALLAGLVACVAFGPVVLGSHVAWSHGGAPALAGFALAALVVAARRTPGRRAWALGAGIAGGLAVGAHPTVLALVPGAGAWWLLRAGGDLRTRLAGTVWLLAGSALGYLPGLAFVARSGLEPLSASLARRDYAGWVGAGWPEGVIRWLESLARNLAGPAAAAAADPRPWLAGAVLAAGLIVAWRAGRTLPALVVASGALLMPLLLEPVKLASLTGLRYAAPALPVAAAAVGLGLARGLGSGDRRWRAGALAVAAALLLVPLWSTAAYYRATRAGGVTGAPVLEVVDGLVGAADGRDTLFVDEALDTKLAGGGEVGRAVRALLELAGTAYTAAPADKMRWFLTNGDGATYDLVLAGDTADALGAEFALETQRAVPVVAGQVSRSGGYWGWYRFTVPPR